MSSQPTEWEKLFWQLCIDKGLIARIHKELKKSNIKTVNNSINNDYRTKRGALKRHNTNG